MTAVDTTVAQAGLANGKARAHGHPVSGSSGSQATSKHPAEQTDGFPDPLLSDASSPSSSLKAISSGDSTGKGKQAATDSATPYLDSDFHKATSSLTPIDESPTDAAFSYSYQDSYRSSANVYAHQSSSYRTPDHVRIDSPDTDEVPYSPTTYPPISEEDSEAKRVQQNLERWAAEERQRRKAQRSSKLLANRNSVAAGTGGLAQRLSILRTSAQTNNNNLGAGPSSERLADGPGASPSMSYDPRLGAADRRGSGSSSAAAAQGLHRSASSSSFDSSQSLGSLTSDDHRPNRRLPPIGSRVSSATHARNTSSGSGSSSKGLGTTANGSARNPFRDPSDGGAPEVTLEKRASLKPQPTASRPIVIVGRASSIQRRALESGYNSKGKGKGRSMPTIVATDTEAEAEAEAEMGRVSSRVDDENPFASVEDRQPRARTESSTMIHEGGLDEEVALEMAGRAQAELTSGDIGESSLSTDQPIRPPPGRTSTSSSKFRELGITEGDDWIETMGRSLSKDWSRKMRIAPHADGDETAHEQRKPWWTELLCGCSRDEDDDEQVSQSFDTRHREDSTTDTFRPASQTLMRRDLSSSGWTNQSHGVAAVQASSLQLQYRI
ncbi:uncharacterized protein PAN0_012c4438 [Moesziomyces antarcticus]|uniref:Uncharacterized protein n=1 Tax=Pseudozyma antarctica TaxID=84753 RepID=A0A081CHS0_PSEA2|nr:uncharacterized protein PAN0_012c4438 [Moesziomyces antarcticus]GAK66216.1 conserved hypothetical protein [Moesziomyces antarcticus]